MNVEELAEEIVEYIGGCSEWEIRRIEKRIIDAAKAFGLYVCSSKTQILDGFAPAIRKILTEQARRKIWERKKALWQWEQGRAVGANIKSFDVPIPFHLPETIDEVIDTIKDDEVIDTIKYWNTSNVPEQSRHLPEMIDTIKYWNTSNVPERLQKIPPLPIDFDATTDFGKSSFAAMLWQIHKDFSWDWSWSLNSNSVRPLFVVVVTTHDGVVYLQHLRVWRQRGDAHTEHIVMRLNAVTVLSRRERRRFVCCDVPALWSCRKYCRKYVGTWSEETGTNWKINGYGCRRGGSCHCPFTNRDDSWIYRSVFIYEKNLKTVFQQSGFYFDAWILFQQNKSVSVDPYLKLKYGKRFLRFLDIAVTNPAFEIIEKAGLGGLKWLESRLVDPKATNLRDAFGLNIQEIGEIHKMRYSLDVVWFYKYMKARETPVSWTVARFFADEARSICRAGSDAIYRARSICNQVGEMTALRLRRSSPEPQARSILNQIGKMDVRSFEDLLVFLSEISGRDGVRFFAWLCRDKMHIGDYIDYLGECLTLGLDIKNRDVVAPKHPMEAHRRTSMIVAQRRAREREERRQALQARGAEWKAQRQQRFVSLDELIAEAIRLYIPAVLVNGAFESGAYRATVARGDADLIAESMALRHCVGSGGYADAMSRGSSFIFFVRRRESPDAPFFTMQLSPDFRILQLRGKFNCAPPQDVSAFAHEFTAWLRRQEKPAVENADQATPLAMAV